MSIKIKTRSKFTDMFVGSSFEKKPRCGRGWWRPSAWPPPPAKAPGAFAGGGGRRAAAASSTRTTHHDRRGEHRSSFPSFPLVEPIPNQLFSDQHRPSWSQQSAGESAIDPLAGTPFSSFGISPHHLPQRALCASTAKWLGNF